MKRYFSILLLLLPLVSLAQTILPTDTVTLIHGEYQLGMIWNGHGYGAGGGSTGQGTNTGPLGTMIPVQFANGTNPRVKTGASSLHSWFLVVDSASHQLYGTGLNDGCWEGTCSAGGVSNFIAVPGATNIRQVWASALPGTIAQTAFVLVVKYDGTVWRLGTKLGGLPGDGTSYGSGDDSVLVQVPGLAHIASVTGMFMPIAIDSSGAAWDWGNANGVFGVYLGRSGSYLSPGQIVVPGGEPVTEAAGGELVNYLRGANGHLYGWGLYNSMMGIGVSWASNSALSSVTDLTGSQAIGSHRSVLHIGKMMTSSIAILYDSAANDSIVATWGDNPQGSVGTGNQLNFYTTTNPFQWDGNHGENVVSTVQFPLPCVTDAAEIYNGGYFVDYNFIKSRKNKLRFAGRNKNGIACCDVSGDGSGNIDSQYPDSWNDTTFRLINFFSAANFKVQSPWCVAHPTATYCSLYTDSGEAAPTNSAGSNFTATSLPASLTGTATPTSGYTISQVQWSAGCGISFSNNFTNSPTVSGLSAGPNVLTMLATDNYGKTSTANVTVTYSAGVQTGWYWDTAGSDANACTFLLPCKTIAKFNTVYATLSGGDTCYFPRGETFPGEMVANASGSAGNPIVVTAYGTGKEPIIGGLTTLTGWTNVSGNVWSVPYTANNPTMLVLNGALVSQSRTPNQSTGYFNFTVASTTTTNIHDPTNAPNAHIGSKLRVRSNAYTIDTTVVTGATSTDLTISPALSSNPSAPTGGTGWFIIGNLPDSATEWRDTAGTIQVYSVGTPTGVYQVPTNDTLLLTEGTNQVWNNLHFKGGNNVGIIQAFEANSGNLFSGDSITYCYDGMQMRTEGGFIMSNTHLLHCSDNGVQKQNLNNYNNIFLSDTLFDIGMIPGMGHSGSAAQSYSGIIAGDSGCIVKFCQFDSIGYIGVANYGSGLDVDSSLVINPCQTLEDGGGVYTWMSAPATFARQRKIIGVTVRKSGGPNVTNGVSLSSGAGYGIYLDQYSSNVLVSGCSVDSAIGSSYFDHGPGNTFLNNTGHGSLRSDLEIFESGPVITGIVAKHNTWGSPTTTIPGVRLETVNNDLSTMGTIDSNQVAGALATISPYWTFSIGAGDGGTFRTPLAWTTLLGYDAHSTFQTGSLLFLYNATNTSATTSLWTKYQDLNGGVHSAVTLPGYSAGVYFIYQLGFMTRHKVGKPLFFN